MQSKVKILVDINVPQEFILFFQEKLFDVRDIKKEKPKIKDKELIELAKSDDRIIITFDKDFIELGRHRKIKHIGIVVLKTGYSTSHYKVCKNLSEFLKTNSINGKLVIVEKDIIKIFEE